MEQFDFFDASQEETNARWKEIMEPHLRIGESFQIHCWNEEKEEIQQACAFGRVKETDWQYGTVISGVVTEDLIRCLLSAPKPPADEIYNKMTPFFSIFLEDGFSSEHYGTELNDQ